MDFMKKTLNQVNVQENTLYDIIYDLFFFAKLQESEDDIKNGRVCTLEELRQHINLFKFLFRYIPNPPHGLYNMNPILLFLFLLLKLLQLTGVLLPQPFLNVLILLYQYHLI